MSETNDNFLVEPYRTLGVTPSATPEEIRARYLELIKQYPPEHASGKFSEIQAAYKFVIDPLNIAKRIIHQVLPSEDITLESILESQKEKPPKMSAQFLLSLGNRSGKEEQ